MRPLPGTDDDPDVKYYAVLCRTCKSHVAVMDSDEVYHFFKLVNHPRRATGERSVGDSGGNLGSHAFKADSLLFALGVQLLSGHLTA